MLEEFSSQLAMIAMFVGTIMALGYLPQVYKIYRRKSSADISVGSYLIWLATSVVWLVYGMAIGDYPLIITGIVNTMGSSLVIVLYFAYNKK